MHVVRPAQGVGRNLGQADAADLARLHQFGQRADAVLDRHALVPAVQVVEIDDVGLQPLQAVLAGLLQYVGMAVELALALCIAERPALAGQNELAAMFLEHVADQGFVGAEAV